MEPGRDGVGDYTRILAASLIKLGNKVTAISLNDEFVSAEIIEIQNSNGIDLPVIRIPKNWSHKKSFEKAKACINTLNPDYISIQFVIFAFDDKGLPFYSIKYLSRLTNGRNCHIMFHELWVGINKNSSLKYFLWGLVQQKIIIKIIKKINPFIIHTHTKLYQHKLLQYGVKAQYLPLFGNIPVLKRNTKSLDFIQNKILELVLFGTIHPNVPVLEFVRELQYCCLQLELTLKITIVGRTGSNIVFWINAFNQYGVNFISLGECPPSQISEIMSKSSIGISTTPIEFAEKSGTIAAMREHGLPVICVAQLAVDDTLQNFTYQKGILKYIPGNLKVLLSALKNIPEYLQVQEIAKQFEAALIFKK